MFSPPRPTDERILATDPTNFREVLELSRQIPTQDLWRIYGINSKAGKLLFDLYPKGNRVRIDYPKPSIKSPSRSLPPIREQPKFFSPQKAVIKYPPVTLKSPKKPKIHPIDLVGSKKRKEVIFQELENFYKKPDIPPKGLDRSVIIKETQDKFKVLRGGLPKGAELPYIPENELKRFDIEQKELKKRAFAKARQKEFFLIDKMSKSLHEKEEIERLERKKKSRGDQDAELEILYTMVEKEILDRLEYLEEMDRFDEPQIKARIKNEIVERMSELERIIRLLHMPK